MVHLPNFHPRCLHHLRENCVLLATAKLGRVHDNKHDVFMLRFLVFNTQLTDVIVKHMRLTFESTPIGVLQMVHVFENTDS